MLPVIISILALLVSVVSFLRPIIISNSKLQISLNGKVLGDDKLKGKSAWFVLAPQNPLSFDISVLNRSSESINITSIELVHEDGTVFRPLESPSFPLPNVRVESLGVYEGAILFALEPQMYFKGKHKFIVKTVKKTLSFPIFVTFPGGKYYDAFQKALNTNPQVGNNKPDAKQNAKDSN